MGYLKQKSCFTNCDEMLNFENFVNEGTNIQRSVIHVLLNILPPSLLPMVNDTSYYFGMQTASSYHFRFEENR